MCVVQYVSCNYYIKKGCFVMKLRFLLGGYDVKKWVNRETGETREYGEVVGFYEGKYFRTFCDVTVIKGLKNSNFPCENVVDGDFIVKVSRDKFALELVNMSIVK